jgi:hypothetical protein
MHKSRVKCLASKNNYVVLTIIVIYLSRISLSKENTKINATNLLFFGMVQAWGWWQGLKAEENKVRLQHHHKSQMQNKKDITVSNLPKDTFLLLGKKR